MRSGLLGRLLLRRLSSKPLYNVPSYPVDLPKGDEGVVRSEGGGQDADYLQSGRVRCYNCGQMGHISYDCQMPQVRKACYVCGNPGHVSRDCPQKIKVVVCFYCRKTGHMTTDCPERKSGTPPTKDTSTEPPQ